jgi:hypothetical protein
MKLRMIVVLLTASTLVFSQTTKSKDHKPAETKSAESAAMAPQKPAPEQVKLMKTFDGSWTVSGKTEAGPAGPAESASGTEVSRSGPGGFSVVTDAKMRFERMGPFSGHGVMYWDPEEKHYTGTWCDNLGPCATQGVGNWEGDNLVFNSEMKMGGQSAKMRQTYSKITADSYEFKIEMADQSGTLKPWMTLNYKRAAAKQ